MCTGRTGTVVGIFSSMVFLGALALPGCSEQGKTGTLVEKAEGQDTGEKASMDAMKAMMKDQGGEK